MDTRVRAPLVQERQRFALRCGLGPLGERPIRAEHNQPDTRIVFHVTARRREPVNPLEQALVRFLTDDPRELVEHLLVVVRVSAFLHDLRDRLLQRQPVPILVAVHVLAHVPKTTQPIGHVGWVVPRIRRTKHHTLLLDPAHGRVAPVPLPQVRHRR